ncbi:peptidoglycan-binding domain-containing protein [Planotetraspora kaengkrachanensis]|nr:peptidoglycan-binding domain-containing protein [Planotetraspora kaengkrachanensis]
MTLELWCPFADHKPLGSQTQPKIGVPRIFILHTMSGFLRGTDSMFRTSGYTGTESTFGIGGSYDPEPLDGAIWQWQDLTHSADAQFAGNRYSTSVETSDGAKSGVRWSDKQAESLIRLGVWWCKQTGHPARLVTSPSGTGFGYHSQLPVWNENSHNCPGPVRLGQYKAEIIPEIARRLGGTHATSSTAYPGRLLRYPPLLKGDDVRRWQAQMKKIGYSIDVDGYYGPKSKAVCVKFQKAEHLDADGIVGPKTWKAAFAHR